MRGVEKGTSVRNLPALIQTRYDGLIKVVIAGVREVVRFWVFLKANQQTMLTDWVWVIGERKKSRITLRFIV